MAMTINEEITTNLNDEEKSLLLIALNNHNDYRDSINDHVNKLISSLKNKTNIFTFNYKDIAMFAVVVGNGNYSSIKYKHIIDRLGNEMFSYPKKSFL